MGFLDCTFRCLIAIFKKVDGTILHSNTKLKKNLLKPFQSLEALSYEIERIGVQFECVLSPEGSCTRGVVPSGAKSGR